MKGRLLTKPKYKSELTVNKTYYDLEINKINPNMVTLKDDNGEFVHLGISHFDIENLSEAINKDVILIDGLKEHLKDSKKLKKFLVTYFVKNIDQLYENKHVTLIKSCDDKIYTGISITSPYKVINNYVLAFSVFLSYNNDPKIIQNFIVSDSKFYNGTEIEFKKALKIFYKYLKDL